MNQEVSMTHETPRLKFGQRVSVNRRGVRTDLLAKLTEPIRGQIVSVISEDATLANCVLVSFDETRAAQWVHEDYVSAADRRE